MEDKLPCGQPIASGTPPRIYQPTSDRGSVLYPIVLNIDEGELGLITSYEGGNRIQSLPVRILTYDSYVAFSCNISFKHDGRAAYGTDRS